MNPFSNAYEKKWTAVFLLMYIFIMLPLPCFYATEYIPAFKGTPLFIWGWLAHGLAVMALIFLWWKSSMRRPEYHEFGSED